MSAAFHPFPVIDEPIARTAPPGAGAAPGAEANAASVLDEITRLVGPEIAATLVEEFGGRRLYIPMEVARGDVLTRAIGVTRARKLSRIFGGDRIDVPADFNHARRRTRIVILRRRGLSIPAIARTLRCTERYVYKVLAKRRTG